MLTVTESGAGTDSFASCRIASAFACGRPRTRLVAAVRPAQRLPAIAASHAELGGFDRRTQLLQMIHNFGGGFSRKENVELFSAASVGLSPASHSRQAGRDQA